MDLIDGSYLLVAGLVGALARAMRRGLPEGWRLRLEAEPAEDLPADRWIWIHAVSVGELLLADGLVKALRAEGHRLHLTTGTPAGLSLLRQRLPGWDGGTGRVSGGAFPFDDPEGLRPFFLHPPGLFLALETELWPNLLRELQARDIPRVIVNGRLTPRSIARGGPWMGRAASRVSIVAARDDESAKAFSALGAEDVRVTGNLKADLPPPPAWSERWQALNRAWAGDPVLVVGNTVEGEEALVLEAWVAARRKVSNLRMILAPRQPKRFEEAAAMLEGQSFWRASGDWPSTEDACRAKDILLLDTLGELPRAWSMGTLAWVGGGWRSKGGHNPLESLRFGVPTWIGPGFDNFQDVVLGLKGSAKLSIRSEEELCEELIAFLTTAPLRADGQPDPALASLLGATDRTLDVLRKVLPSLETAP
jgi:3-deoxy-D-manno-octulosonic-acid transferase